MLAQISDGKLQLGGLFDSFKVNISEQYGELIESFKSLDLSDQKFFNIDVDGKQVANWDAISDAIGGADDRALSYFKTLDDGNGTIRNTSASVQGMQASVENTGKAFDFATIKATALNTVLNMGIALAVSAGFQLLATVIDNVVNRTQHLIDAGKEAKSTIANIGDELKKNANVVNQGQRFDELRVGVDQDTNENISLTNEEYSEYLALCNEIAEVYPSLVQSYDSQGNAILNLGTSAETATSQLQGLYEVDQAIANLEIADNLQAAYEGTKAEVKEIQKDIDDLNESADAYDSTLNTISGKDINNLQNQLDDLASGKTNEIRLDSTMANYSDIYSTLTREFAKSGIYSNVTNDNNDAILTFMNLPTGQQLQDAVNDVKKGIVSGSNEISQVVSEQRAENLYEQSLLQREQDAKWAELVPSVISSFETNPNYLSLGENIQTAIAEAVGNFDFSTIPTDIKDFGMFMKKNFLYPIASAFEDDGSKIVQGAFNSLFSLDNINLFDYQQSLKVIEGYFNEIYPEDAAEKFENFKLSFGFDVETDVNGQKVVQDKVDNLFSYLQGYATNEEDVNLLKGLTVSQLFDLDSLLKDSSFKGTFAEAIDQILNGIDTEAISEKFREVLATDGTKELVDNFQSDMSTIKSTMESLAKGDEVDMTDLMQQFEGITGNAETLNEELSNLQLDKVKQFSNAWRAAMAGITDPAEITEMQNFFNSLMNSVDFALENVDSSKIRKAIFSNIQPATPADWKVLNTAFEEFGDTVEGREILLKLSLDPDAATWTLDDWINKYNETEIDVKVKATTDSIDDSLAKIDILKSAMSEQSSNGFLTKDTMKTLVDNDFVDILQNTSSGMMINTEAANEWADAQMDLNISLVKSQKEAAKLKYGKNQQDMIELAREAGYTCDSIDDLNSILEQNPNAPDLSDVFHLKALNDNIFDNIATLQMYEANLSGMSSLLQRYREAQSTPNASDNYNEIVTGRENANKLYDRGWVGMDDFTTYAQLIAKNGDSLEEAVMNYEENSKRMERYFTEDTGGLINFLNDAVAKSDELDKSFVTLSDGRYTIDIDNMDEFANDMGITTELAENMLLALNDAGMEVDLSVIGDSLKEQVMDIDATAANAGQQIQNTIDKAKLLASQGVPVADSIKELTTPLKELSDAGVDVSGFVEQINELGELNGFHVDPTSFEIVDTSLAVMTNRATEAQQALALLDGQDATASVTVNGTEYTRAEIDSVVNDLASLPVEKLIEMGFDFKEDEIPTKEDIESQLPTVKFKSTVAEPENTGSISGTVDSGTVTTTATFDDTQANADVTAYKQSLEAIPEEKTTEAKVIIPDEEVKIDYGVGEQEPPKDQSANVNYVIGIQKPPVPMDQEVEINYTLGKQAQPESKEIPVDYTLGSQETPVDQEVEVNYKFGGQEVPISKEVDVNYALGTQEVPVDQEVVVDYTLGKQEEPVAKNVKANYSLGTQAAPVNKNANVNYNLGVQAAPIDKEVDIDYTLGEQDAPLDKEANVTYLLGEGQEPPENKDALVNYKLGENQEPPQDKDANVTYKNDAENQDVPDDKDALVTYKYNDQDDPKDKNADVDYDLGNQDNPLDKSAIVNYQLGYQEPPKEKTVKVNYDTSAAPSSNSHRYLGLSGNINGTAYAGNMSLGAFANGNKWALDRDQDALINEDGKPESIVRDGQWFVVPGGAHVESLQKGDIIFNAKQTEELIKYGRAISNGGHGRFAFANGTAYNSMPAFNSKASGGGIPKAPSNTFGTNENATSTQAQAQAAKEATTATKQNTAATKENTKEKEKEPTVFDWVKERLEYFANKTKQIADSITDYVSSAFKQKQLKNQMKAIDNEITANEKGYKTYTKKANSVGLSSSWKKKVQQGDFDIESVKDEDLAKKIQDYQQWYDAAQECKNAVTELKNEQMELFEQWANMPTEKAEKKIAKLERSIRSLDAAYSALSGGGSTTSTYLNQIQKDYNSRTKTAKKERDTAKTEYTQAKKDYNTAKTKNTKAEKATDKSAKTLKSAAKNKKNKVPAATQKRINDAIKNGQKVDTKGLKGKVLSAAKDYNKKLAKEETTNKNVKSTKKTYTNAKEKYSTAKDKYNTAKDSLSEGQKAALKYAGDVTYKGQNALLDLQLDYSKQTNKERQTALKEATDNLFKEQQALDDAQENANKKSNKKKDAIQKRDDKKEKLLNNKKVKNALSKSQLNDLKNGKTVDTKGIKDKGVLKQIQDYNKLVNSATTATNNAKNANEQLTDAKERYNIALDAQEEAEVNAAEAEAEYAEMAVQNEIEKFNNIKDYYDARIDYLETINDLESKNVELSKYHANGKNEAQASYDTQIQNARDQKATDEEKLAALNEQLNSTDLKEGSEEWYQVMRDIKQTEGDLKDDELTILQLQEEKFNNIADSYEASLGYMESLNALEEKSISLSKAKANGNAEIQASLSRQQDNVRQQIATEQAEIAELEALLPTLDMEKDSEKWLEVQTTLANLRGNIMDEESHIIDLEIEKFNNVKDYYETRIDYMEQLNDLEEKGLEMSKAHGNYETQGDISMQMQNKSELQSFYEQEAFALQAQLNKSVEDGIIEYQSADWYDLQAQILGAQSAAKGLEVEMEELRQNSVDLELEQMFDRAIKRADQYIDKLDTINDLITDEMKYNSETGELTEFGMLSLAINGRGLQENLNDLQTLVKKRQEIINGFYSGDYGQQKYDELMEDVDKDIQTHLKNASSYRDAILDIVKDQAEAELDALKDIIDARKEALNKKKEYYDYDRNLKNQNLEINALKQQIAALEGVSTAEAKAEKERKKAELAEREQELKDTIQNHIYDLQIDGLDELSLKLDEDYEKYVNELNTNLDKMTDLINEAMDKVAGSTADVMDVFNEILEQFNLHASDIGMGYGVYGQTDYDYDIPENNNDYLNDYWNDYSTSTPSPTPSTPTEEPEEDIFTSDEYGEEGQLDRGPEDDYVLYEEEYGEEQQLISSELLKSVLFLQDTISNMDSHITGDLSQKQYATVSKAVEMKSPTVSFGDLNVNVQGRTYKDDLEYWKTVPSAITEAVTERVSRNLTREFNLG